MTNRENRMAVKAPAETTTGRYGVFRSSSYCNGGSCVAVAMSADGAVLVRDQKDTAQQPLAFTRSEWVAFIKGVRNSEFDVE
jgi:hypothetical protein